MLDRIMLDPIMFDCTGVTCGVNPAPSRHSEGVPVKVYREGWLLG